MCLVLALTLLAGCGGSSGPSARSNSRSAEREQPQSDLRGERGSGFQRFRRRQSRTANLTNQGLQRSLLMATFLKRRVLGRKNVTGVYALEPMTHLQTAGNYPDMAALETFSSSRCSTRSRCPARPRRRFPVYRQQLSDQCVVCASVPLPSGVATPPHLPELPGPRFRRPGRRQRNPGKRHHHGECAGLLCLLGAVGDHQRPAGKYQ